MTNKLVSLAKRGPFLFIIGALVLSITAGVVLAVNFTLNQTVPITITVTPAGGGSGGGGGGTPPPSTAVLYTSDNFSEALSSLTFTYPVAGQGTYTAYVKTAEISAVGPVTLTLNGGKTGPGITATLGSDVSGARPVTITASGGVADNYTGNVTFTGSGSTP